MHRTFLLLLLLPLFLAAPRAGAAEEPCGVTLQSGDDIGQAASRGRVVCLAPGTYNPFVIDRTSMGAVTVRGLDPVRSVIQTSSSSDVIVYGAPGVTLSNFTVKGPKAFTSHAAPE